MMKKVLLFAIALILSIAISYAQPTSESQRGAYSAEQVRQARENAATNRHYESMKSNNSYKSSGSVVNGNASSNGSAPVINEYEAKRRAAENSKIYKENTAYNEMIKKNDEKRINDYADMLKCGYDTTISNKQRINCLEQANSVLQNQINRSIDREKIRLILAPSMIRILDLKHALQEKESLLQKDKSAVNNNFSTQTNTGLGKEPKKVSINKFANYLSHLDNLNLFFKKIDNGNYGSIDVADGEIFIQLKSGPSYSTQIKNLDKAYLVNENKNIVIKCFGGKDCIVVDQNDKSIVKTNLNAKDMLLSNTVNFNAAELTQLFNNLINAYKENIAISVKENQPTIISKKAIITNEYLYYGNIDELGCFDWSWASSEQKKLSISSGWGNYKPKKNDEGVVVHSVKHCSNGVDLVVLKIGNNYVPMTADAIKVVD